jgi:hypothetical protein
MSPRRCTLTARRHGRVARFERTRLAAIRLVLQTDFVTARIGADDIHEFATPRQLLLREVSGITPEDPAGHVLLEPLGVKSTQRLALADVGGTLVAGLWPAELKTQAVRLYGTGRATPMIATAREQGWTVEASPHIGFYNSSPAQRLYMRVEIDAAEYARRWEQDDLAYVRQYAPEEVRTTLWPWLKDRDYASDSDDGTFDSFVSRTLKNRPAHLRPGLRMKRRWDRDELRGLNRHAVAAAIRTDVNAILTAAAEPLLPSATGQ